MKSRVLIVEDDRWFAEICADSLSDCDVRICHDAQAAIEAIDAVVPNIILLDLMLPGSNGVAFLQELRSYQDTRETPVIVCSSLRMTPAQQQGMKAFDPVCFLNKADVTAERLQKVISHQSSGGLEKVLTDDDRRLATDDSHGHGRQT